jgi:hypothetical protein
MNDMIVNSGERHPVAPNCPICESEARPVRRMTVLRRHEAVFNLCPSCGLLFVDAPTWLDEAYSSAIALSDTGIMYRNLDAADRLTMAIPALVPNWKQSRFLDTAGGYGILVRLMRDRGFDFYWQDEYAENLLARGFEQDTVGPPFVVVTAVEVLEHLVDPVAFVRSAFESCGADHLITTTELYRDDPPPTDWWYYTPETGQHVSIYSKRTIERLARQVGVHAVVVNGLQIFSRMPIAPRRLRLVTGPIRRLLARPPWSRDMGRVVSDHDHFAKPSQPPDAGTRKPEEAGRSCEKLG